MDDLDLFKMFGAALGLAPPWQVTSVQFDKLLGVLDIGLDFRTRAVPTRHARYTTR